MKENSSYICYVVIGLIFEVLFLIFNAPKDLKIQTYFSVMFPFILSISIVYRLFKYPILLNSLLSITLFIIYITLNNSDFFAINYIINNALYLFLLVKKVKNGKLKWYYSIDSLIIINMYFMYITSLLSQKVISWDNSQLLESFHLTVSIFLIITLCLINVKLWRSSFN